MSRRSLAVFLALVLPVAACSAPPGTVRARHGATAVGVGAEAPATLVLEFTHAVEGAHVSIDGDAVVSGVRARRVVIDHIPSGEVSVMLAADGGVEKAFRVHLAPGQRVVVPIAAPSPPRAPHPVVQALVTVSVYAAYLGLASLF